MLYLLIFDLDLSFDGSEINEKGRNIFLYCFSVCVKGCKAMHFTLDTKPFSFKLHGEKDKV